MEEILPGIHHWTAFHEALRAPVHSYYVEPAGALIDPMVPEEGLEVFAGMRVRPQQALLTNRHHFRQSDRFREAFDCLVRLSARALPLLERDLDVTPYTGHDEVAPGIVAVEIGVVGLDEMALHIAHGEGACAFGHSLISAGGVLGYPSDDLLGNRPQKAKHELKHAFTGLLVRDFDALLFAHAAPVGNEGKARLRRFVEEPTEYPEFGRYA
jgi:hypothetical protein